MYRNMLVKMSLAVAFVKILDILFAFFVIFASLK